MLFTRIVFFKSKFFDVFWYIIIIQNFSNQIGDLKTHIVRVHKEEFLDERVIRYNEQAPIPDVDASKITDGWSNPYVRNVFRCIECSKELQWKHRSQWKIHYESHLDIRRFGCYVCPKEFRLKGDLKTHVTRVHKVEFEDHRVLKLDQQQQ